jgi:hypothetical protein
MGILIGDYYEETYYNGGFKREHMGKSPCAFGRIRGGSATSP